MHFMRTLPTGSFVPNFGRRVRHRRELNILQDTWPYSYSFFFQAEDGIGDWSVTGVQTCALPISARAARRPSARPAIADSPLLRSQGPRPRARRARQGPAQPRRAALDASEPRNLAPDLLGKRVALSPKLAWRLNRLRRMSPAEIAYRVLRAVQARAERSRFSSSREVPEPDLGYRAAPWIHAGARVEAPRYIATADRIAEGKVDVFALRDVDLGMPPRWNRDPKTGIEAPLVFGKLL